MMRFTITHTDTVTTDVTVMPADRMRAERLSTSVLPPSQRGPQAAKTHSETWVLLWLYTASQRLQHVAADVSFEVWADTVLDYDRVTADTEAVPEVDPTQPTVPTPSP